MKNYIHIDDISNLSETIQKAISLKKNPYAYQHLGKNKTLVMLFFNSSLRTRLSTEKAAKNVKILRSIPVHSLTANSQ